MTAYFIRRLIFAGISIMVFAITRFVPGVPMERIIANARQMQDMGPGYFLALTSLDSLGFGFGLPAHPPAWWWQSYVAAGVGGNSS